MILTKYHAYTRTHTHTKSEQEDIKKKKEASFVPLENSNPQINIVTLGLYIRYFYANEKLNGREEHYVAAIF